MIKLRNIRVTKVLDYNILEGIRLYIVDAIAEVPFLKSKHITVFCLSNSTVSNIDATWINKLTGKEVGWTVSKQLNDYLTKYNLEEFLKDK